MSGAADPIFRGDDGAECEAFIGAIRKSALEKGRQRDNDWIADFASSCFVGQALRWFETLDDSIQGDWKLLRQAMLERYPYQASSVSIQNRSVIPTPAAAPPVAQPVPLRSSSTPFRRIRRIAPELRVLPTVPNPKESTDDGIVGVAVNENDFGDSDRYVSFKKGDRLIRIDFSDDHGDAWWSGTNARTGKRGLFYSPHVMLQGDTSSLRVPRGELLKR